MKRNYIADSLGCILFRLFSPIIRILPKGLTLFFGRRLGDLFYSFDLKHKAIAYTNIKTALGSGLTLLGICHLTKKFYRTFGQNLIEILFIPLMDKKYMNKYVDIKGLQHISEGFRRGKGVILLGMHEGSWELTNVICANLNFPFTSFVRDQRHPRLNNLLNSYRRQKGCKIIQRKNQIRRLIDTLKNNEAIAMTADQGGRVGVGVKFFGKDASMASGAIRLALKYGATIIPAFYTRVLGAKIKLIIEPPFEIERSGDLKEDIRNNLLRIVQILERFIRQYPQEYLWTYKIWKYSRQRNVLILNDGITGHLRQSQAAGSILSESLRERGLEIKIDTLKVEFKNKLAKTALASSSLLAGRYHCQGCLWCLRTFLKENVYQSIRKLKPDIVISCGSSLAAINFVISRENQAKSIVIMRPFFLSTGRFDLVIMPRHDYPPQRKNVVVTEGALNLINEEYLKEQSERLIQASVVSCQLSDICIGLLIGGDTKNFTLKQETMAEIIRQIKSASEKLNADILVTTSRRTSREVEELVKEEFKNYSLCKLLIVANENNIPEGVGGILGLSKMIIVSPESISMISEAVSSKKYIFVFKAMGLSERHCAFLDYFARNKYIDLGDPVDLGRRIEEVWLKRPALNFLKDNLLVREAIKKIL